MSREGEMFWGNVVNSNIKCHSMHANFDYNSNIVRDSFFTEFITKATMIVTSGLFFFLYLYYSLYISILISSLVAFARRKRPAEQYSDWLII